MHGRWERPKAMSRPPAAVSKPYVPKAGFRALERPCRQDPMAPSQVDPTQWLYPPCLTPPPLRGQRRILTGFPILRLPSRRHLEIDDIIALGPFSRCATMRHRLRNWRQTKRDARTVAHSGNKGRQFNLLCIAVGCRNSDPPTSRERRFILNATGPPMAGDQRRACACESACSAATARPASTAGTKI